MLLEYLDKNKGGFFLQYEVFSIKLSKTCSLSSHIKSNKSAGSSFGSLKLQPQDWQNFATSSFGLVQEEQGEAGFQILGIP